MAVEADTRKDALIEEIRVSAKEAKEKLDKEREQVVKDQTDIECQRREIKENSLAAKKKQEELEYQKRELSNRVD